MIVALPPLNLLALCCCCKTPGTAPPSAGFGVAGFTGEEISAMRAALQLFQNDTSLNCGDFFATLKNPESPDYGLAGRPTLLKTLRDGIAGFREQTLCTILPQPEPPTPAEARRPEEPEPPPTPVEGGQWCVRTRQFPESIPTTQGLGCYQTEDQARAGQALWHSVYRAATSRVEGPGGQIVSRRGE